MYNQLIGASIYNTVPTFAPGQMFVSPSLSEQVAD
jgi:hypothetical protein